MKKILLYQLLIFLLLNNVNGQESDTIKLLEEDYFAKRTAKFIGLPAPLFEAPDLDGRTHYLDTYGDHIVILHFWQAFSDPSISQIPSLNRIIEEYFDQGVVVLGFSTNDIADLTEFKKLNEIKYPVIPNSWEFSQEYYGGEMGYPRVFLIDKYGIVQKVFIGGKSGDYMDLYHKLVPSIEEHLKY